MRAAFCGMAWAVLLSPTTAAVESGPPAGEAVPPLTATTISEVEGGPAEVKPDTDVVEARGKKPTVYVFLPEKHWTDLKLAGFLKSIDDAMRTAADTQTVLVFTTDNPRAAADYLERRAWVFDLPHTTMAVHDKSGELKEWKLSPEAAVTAVVAKDGKVVDSLAFARPADADATAVLRAMKAAK